MALWHVTFVFSASYLVSYAEGWSPEISYDFYNREYTDDPFTLDNLTPKTLHRSPFDRKKPTVLTIHGFLGFTNEDMIQALIKAYIEKGDYNVINVAWKASNYPNYNAVCLYVPKIAEKFASDINDLLATGTNPNGITIVGFSLGAHISGIAGQRLSKQIGRVVGIDPARPNFKNKRESERISKKSAKYVEIIHISGYVGSLETLGHVDFFVNGGKQQPGCWQGWVKMVCEHHRGVWYYAEAISDPSAFKGIRCSNYNDFFEKNCYQDSAYIAQDINASYVPGNYFLQTASTSPFGLGAEGTEPMRPKDPDEDKYDYDVVERVNDFFGGVENVFNSVGRFFSVIQSNE